MSLNRRPSLAIDVSGARKWSAAKARSPISGTQTPRFSLSSFTRATVVLGPFGRFTPGTLITH